MLQEHYEAVMRRTLERSQRVEQRQKRWSWGGISESDNRPARKPLASPVDGGFLSRLLTPTQASIARSKSAAALSEGGEAPASASPLHLMQRGPVRSRSIDRQKSTTLPTSASADQLNPSLVRHHESGRHMKT
uniref:Uncharacterized protein n=1 Tax=Hucho hucho TaxID=62062 RepID=A0A4W5QS51_9TELE